MKVTCPKCHKEFETSEDKPTSAKCPHCNATLAFKYSDEEDEKTKPEQEPEKIPFKVKAKNFWSKHKVKIIAGATIVVGVIVTVVLYNKNRKDSEKSLQKSPDLLPELEPDNLTNTAIPSNNESANYLNGDSSLPIDGASVVEESYTPSSYSIPKAAVEDVPSQRTDIELSLLNRLAAGEFDGYDGSYWWPNSIYWCTIENGTPIRWKQGPGSTFFNGEENERIPGKTSVYKRYITDDEKLEFFRAFGRDMSDEEANNYYWDNWRKRYMR